MGINNVIFLEVLEWFDQTGTEVSHCLPEIGSGEIKLSSHGMPVRSSALNAVCQSRPRKTGKEEIGVIRSICPAGFGDW